MSTYSIVVEGMRRLKGVKATEPLTAADFVTIAQELQIEAKTYWKIAPVSARQAEVETEVVTKWEGEDTRNVAKVGDWIVTNLDSKGRILKGPRGNPNQYVIRQERFLELYEKTIGETKYGAIYCSKGRVDALDIPGSLDIKAPWGERQTLKSGYLLFNGTDVYGITRQTFEETYEPVTL